MKIYKYTALVVVLFCSFLSSDCFAKSYICKFYEHADMGGGYFEDGAGSRNRLETDWNDKVSSVWIENRYKVTIYEHADFSGKKQTLYGERGGTLYNLTDTNFNDVLSSYRIEKVSSDRYKTREKKDRYKDRYREDREQYRRGYCIFYEHADKQGAYFHSDTEKQSSLDIKWNDRISSVWVRNGYALTIYEHAGYRGRKETLHGRKDGALFNLTDMNFNDMISSYRIEKTSYERDKYKTPGKKDRYKDSHWKDWEPHKGNYCTFYKHANKKGAYFHGKTGRHPFVGDSWNDKISSVWVRDGYAVTIYENAGYGGRSETLHGKKGGALFNLTDMSFNDAMSSYRIEKTPDRTDRESYNENYCIFYEHTNKKGAYFHGKAGGEPFVKDNWNDKISSVWVREGYTVTIYEHSNFSGRKKLLKGRKGGTLYNLTDIGFNDMISSYKAGINHKQLRELLKKNMPLK